MYNSTQLAEFPNARLVKPAWLSNVGVDFTEKSADAIPCRPHSKLSILFVFYDQLPSSCCTTAVLAVAKRRYAAMENLPAQLVLCTVWNAIASASPASSRSQAVQPQQPSVPIARVSSTSRSQDGIASFVDDARIHHVSNASNDRCPAGPENGTSIGSHPSSMPSPLLTGPSTQLQRAAP